MDVAKGPWPEARFDRLHADRSFHHVPDLDGAIRAFHTFLNPGGRLRVSPTWTRRTGSFHGPRRTSIRVVDRRDLAGRLERAGFRDIRFATPYVVHLERAMGMASYPLFLAVAERG